MHLSALLSALSPLGCTAEAETEITALTHASGEVVPGALFVAIPGYVADGHDFIGEAGRRGAAAVVCEHVPAEEIPYVLVPDSRAALAALAAVWYGRPADGLTVVGVTGTNGKTTTTHLIKAMLEGALGARVGLIGTIHNLIGNEELPAARTTPEALELQRLLRRMTDAGCTHVVMEVSSHALLLHRADGIRFAAGVFTNLTQDHLDFHGTMANYRAAKGRLFAQSDTAVLNLDDEAGTWYRENLSCPAVTYSENQNEADVVAKNIRLHPDHVTFEAVSAEAIARATVPIPGGFTIYNALATVACARALGIPLKDACASLGGARGVKGRIEVVPTGRDFTVLIDYAHTPNALENILLAVRDFAPGRIILVFGCGGDRDRSKRPIMGAAAAAGADILVVTSDNPRTEKPEAIIADILPGIPKDFPALRVEADRSRAIGLALSLARAGDIVLLCGKGHETYQIVGHETRHFDEREVVAARLADM